jgi:hypothetical protein|tara:strand:- start:321 stop:437 length:117 start_codon:yes stop_codon:yes gene_type:complete
MQIKKQYQKNIINMIFIEKKLYLGHEIKKSKSLLVDQF